MPPTVSVIIPTYQRAELLREAVDSALRQTFADLEVVVVEDGSRTAAEVLGRRDPRVVHRWQQHRGVSAARNLGAASAGGEWLAFLDDDDLWEPDKLAKQLALIARQPEVGMVHTDHRVLSDGTLRLGPRIVPRSEVPSGIIGRALYLNNFVVLSSVLIRRTVFERVGGFATAFSIAADYDLWLRVSREHRIAFLGEPLTIYRDHSSMSSDTPQTALECASVLAAHARSAPAIWKEYGSKLVRRRLFDAHCHAAYAHYLVGDYSRARRLYLSAWLWQPWSTRAIVAAGATGPVGLRLLRLVRRASRARSS